MITSLGWKVPYRYVYCETFGTWIRETIWCHVVLRLFPRATSTSVAPEFRDG